MKNDKLIKEIKRIKDEGTLERYCPETLSADKLKDFMESIFKREK